MTLDKPWLNASLTVDARVALLLAAMTLDEKVAQLGYDLYYCGDPAAAVKAHPLGMGGCNGAAGSANATNELRAAFATTRLGIPPSVYGETTHVEISRVATQSAPLRALVIFTTRAAEALSGSVRIVWRLPVFA